MYILLLLCNTFVRRIVRPQLLRSHIRRVSTAKEVRDCAAEWWVWVVAEGYTEGREVLRGLRRQDAQWVPVPRLCSRYNGHWGDYTGGAFVHHHVKIMHPQKFE